MIEFHHWLVTSAGEQVSPVAGRERWNSLRGDCLLLKMGRAGVADENERVWKWAELPTLVTPKFTFRRRTWTFLRSITSCSKVHDHNWHTRHFYINNCIDRSPRRLSSEHSVDKVYSLIPTRSYMGASLPFCNMSPHLVVTHSAQSSDSKVTIYSSPTPVIDEINRVPLSRTQSS